MLGLGFKANKKTGRDAHAPRPAFP